MERIEVEGLGDDWWIHAPSLQDVQVVGGSVTLPFLARKRIARIQGDPGVQLAGYLAETVSVPQGTIDSSTSPGFATP